MSSFEFPDFDAPLDTDARIAAAPENGTVRGMFFQQILEELGDNRPEWVSGSHIAFGSYPMRDFMRLLVEGAERLYPSVSVREGLRRLGHLNFPKFSNTMVGSAIFAVAGRDYGKVVSLAGKAYGVSMSPGRVSTVRIGPNHARVQMVDVWTFPECYQIGVFEGAMKACGVTGRIQIAQHSESSADYDLQW
jgi:uncharacterized protein (TIGR02265 family)